MLTAVLALALALQGTDTTIAVRPGTRLDLNSFEGDITITTWSRASVRIEADHDDDTRVSVDQGAGRLSVRGRSRYGPAEVTWRLTVPADLPLELSAHSGRIRVEGTRGSVSAKSIEGDIRVRGGGGFVSLQSVEGALEVADAVARVSLSTVDGDVSASQIRGDISVTTVDGAIRLEGIEASDVEASTVDGNIDFQGAVLRGGRYKLGSHDGNVTVTVPSIDAVVSVSTFDGDFESDWPITLSGFTTRKQFSFTLGGGNARLELESFDGTVALRKGSGRRAP